jgi:hypothetical protein
VSPSAAFAQEYAHAMTLPALTPRGFWTRVAVFGASLVVYVWAVLIMAREDSLVGVVLPSLGALLGLTRLVVIVWLRPSGARSSPAASPPATCQRGKRSPRTDLALRSSWWPSLPRLSPAPSSPTVPPTCPSHRFLAVIHGQPRSVPVPAEL